MKPVWKKLLLVLMALGALAGLIIAFLVGRKEVANEAERERPVKAPTRVEIVNGENVVTIDEATRTNSGIVVAALLRDSHRQQVRAYGSVLDPSGLTDLRNSLEGAKAQFSKATATLDVAQKDYQRVKMLYEKNENVSQKVLQAAEGTLKAEEANVQTAQAALNAAEATALQQWGRTIGQWLTQGALEVDRLRTQQDLLVQVTLPPGQMVTDVPAEATVQTAEGKLIAAKFVSPALRTDPRVQGQSFFYVVASEGSPLLPGMTLAALLPIGKTVEGVIVPETAVVWFQGKAWAYAQIQPDHFARRAISTDQPVKGGWFQPAEFSKGDLFVVKGPQVLLSEEFRAQISIGEEGK